MHVSGITVASLACLFGSIALADQVTLKNGDRVTGEIVKKDEKALTMKSAFIGTITVPWEQVDTVKSDAPVTVVLQSGEQLQTAIVPADGKLELQSQQRTVETGQVAAIRNAAEEAAYQRLQHPGLLQLWAGTGTFGLAGTSGNARTSTLTAAVAAARVTRSDKTSIHFDAIKASSLANGVNADTAQAVRGGIAYDHNLPKRFFLTVFNDYEYDKFQNLDLRATFGGGLGYHAWKGERGFLDFIGGADYNRSRFFSTVPNGDFTQSFAELFYGDDFAYTLRPGTAFTQTYRMFNNLTETGNFRINADIGLNTRIMKWLSWTVAASDRYLSNPAPGRKTNDVIYTTGVGITFGSIGGK